MLSPFICLEFKCAYPCVMLACFVHTSSAFTIDLSMHGRSYVPHMRLCTLFNWCSFAVQRFVEFFELWPSAVIIFRPDGL